MSPSDDSSYSDTSQRSKANVNNPGQEQVHDEEAAMDTEEIRTDLFEDIRANQPSIVSVFPGLVEYNCVPELQDKDFNSYGMAYAFNMKDGLILQFDHIMGFFSKVLEKGYGMRMTQLSTLAVLDLSKTTNLILNLQHKSVTPFLDPTDREILPRTVLAVLVIKSDVDRNDCSFFSAFYLAFEELMTNYLDNDSRTKWCERSVINLGKSYPLYRHIISPKKTKRRTSRS